MKHTAINYWLQQIILGTYDKIFKDTSAIQKPYCKIAFLIV